ncbi:MAG: DNA polymerase III subunit delta [Exiguobacterium sp.]|nr:DNA polymerase III subunit delta [Exiguobacterium sp.]
MKVVCVLNEPWLHNGKLSNVYVLFGTEKYLLDTWEREIVKAANPSGDQFDVMRLDLHETSLDTALDEAETVPFFSEYRTVVVKHAQFLTGAKEKQKQNVDRLTEYVLQPAPYSVLVFIVEAEKLDERKKVVKRLKERAIVLEAKKPSQTELMRYVGDELSRRGQKMERATVERLLFLCQDDWGKLVRELEKLQLYASDGAEIPLDVVNDLVPRTLEDNVFQLSEFLVARRADAALRLVRDLEKQGQELIGLLSLLARQYRNMYLTKQLTEKGYGEKQIASKIGAHPYTVKLAGQASRKFTEAQLATALTVIAEADESMKTGRGDKQIVFDTLVCQLTLL